MSIVASNGGSSSDTQPNAIVVSNGTSSSETRPTKRRRKKSVVWEHFTIQTINDGCTRALCKQCKKSFAYISGTKLAGTSHLKRHIDLGICPVSRLRNQIDPLSPDTPSTKTEGSANVAVRARKRYRATPGIVFDQDRSNNDIARMVIKHDYPLEMVEHSGFNNFARVAQPQFKTVDVNTVREHISRIYLREKQNLLGLLDGIPGRVSLSLDLWDSDEGLGYVFLTGHFIDCDWKLHKRILNVMLPCLDSEVAFKNAVAACLQEWNVESKLFTVAMDHSVADESVKGNLRDFLSIRNQLTPKCQLVITSCYARVLSHLAQDAMALFRGTVEKVRESVKYVKTSKAHEDKFTGLKQHLQVPSTKSLTVDDVTKWDTTYQMLVAASELKEVFSCLDTTDPDYIVTISMEEWRQVEILCVYLRLFYDAANIITAPVYPTANIFFDSVCNIQLELKNGTESHDFFVCYLAKPLFKKFSKYWSESNLVLATAAVMDPRFKMGFIEFNFDKIYGRAEGKNWFKVVQEGVRELFLEYHVQSLPLNFEINEDFIEREETSSHEDNTSHEDNYHETTDDGDDGGLSDFVKHVENIMVMSNHQQLEMELDIYLGESTLPRVHDFDVLGWWRNNSCNYPTLSKMASDILCIPVSSVAPESVFDIGNRKVDTRIYRCSSRPPLTLEALVCAKDWLQYDSSTPFPSAAAIVKMEY